MSLEITRQHPFGLAQGAPFSARDTALTVEQSSDQESQRVGRPLPLGTLLLAINQLAVMNQNGIDIAEAVDTVSRHCKNVRLADQLSCIHTSLTEGRSLSAAIAIHGEGFPASISPMLAAAESSGNLPQTLRRITEMLRSEIQLRATIISAMIYPAILITASMLVLTAMMLGVIPQFSKVFESLGKPVPASTQTLLWLGLTCREHWPWIIGTMLATVTGVLMFRRHPILINPFHAFLMHAPIIRDAYRPLMTGRIFRAIASMVAGGVTLLESVRLARRATSDPYWNNLLDEVVQNLLQGSRASEAMKQVDFLPPEAAQLMATAERTGRVADVLEDVGLFYEEDASRRIKRLVAALEPVIIMVMGVVVAGIVMSVMLPMLDVTTMH
ncbi:MAG: type II secretion system F family protein [Planctomycetaceae bacterium]